MKEEPKILIITPSLSGGGAERAAARLSHLDLGVIHVVSLYRKKDSYNFGGTLHQYHFPPQNNPLMKLFYFFRRIQQLRALKKSLDIDVSISFMTQPNIINLLSRRKREKTIVSIRNYPSLKDREAKIVTDKIINKVYPLILKRADAIVVVSEQIKDHYLRHHSYLKDKLVVIYNGVNLDNIDSDSREELSPEFSKLFSKNRCLINIGKLEYQKGQIYLIKVFGYLKEMNKSSQDLKLLILGEGSYRSKLEDLARSMDLVVFDGGNFEFADVFFLGFVKNPFPYLSASKLFILSSLYEGFPNVLIEAMATGLPIASSACPSGPREILTNSNRSFGVLLPSFDSNEKSNENKVLVWVDILFKLLNDEKELSDFSELSRERVGDFSLKLINNKWVEVINA